MAKFKFLRQVPASFTREVEDRQTGEKTTVVSVRGDFKDSADGRVQIRVSPDEVFPATDSKGNVIPKHVNVRMPGEGKVDVSYVNETGNTVRGQMSPAALTAAWEKNQREYAEQQGPKVWLNGVSPAMIQESKVEMKDGSGRHMMNVSVADPESSPKAGKDTGYGSFLVSPDAISDTKDGKKKNIYIGRENDSISGYQIRTGEVDADGKDVYAKAKRTAKDIRTQYEDDIEAYKAKQAQAGNDGKAAEKGADEPEY